MNKEALEALNLMTNQTEIDMGYYYGLTEHIDIYVIGIQYKDQEWSLVVWNDYQDCVTVKIAIKEQEAIDYIKWDYNVRFNNKTQSNVSIEEVEDVDDYNKPITITSNQPESCKCGHTVIPNQKYCHNCGQALKWRNKDE